MPISGTKALFKKWELLARVLSTSDKWFCVNYALFVWRFSATAITISYVFRELG
jgi:hypothetical protein